MLVGIITIILMVLAGLQALRAIFWSLALMSQSRPIGFIALLIGLATAALAFFLAKFWNEAAQIAQILADIGDSVIDANSRTVP
jgi:hypothetical protein